MKTIFPKDSNIPKDKILRVKFGIDPTSDKLHLGHLIPLLEAKRFWLEGHKVDIVLGTFTAQLGDPSGKDATRPILTAHEVESNAALIYSQVLRIFEGPNENHPYYKNLNFHSNGKWFNVMTLPEITKLISKFTLSQMTARDSFQKRIKEQNSIGMHELIVPILQGYDSVRLESDIEIGGTDQLFNFNITRDLQRAFDQEPEVCVLMPIINGTDGRKMSKSLGNCIFLNDAPEDVFGKVMSISDELMVEWWPLITDTKLPLGHPMEIKKDLAWHTTRLIWSDDLAKQAHDHFESVIQNKKEPENMVQLKSANLLHLVMTIRECSKSEAGRLLTAGAVKVDDENVRLEEGSLKIGVGHVIKVGKRHFGKVVEE